MKVNIRKGQPYVVLIYIMGIIMIGFAFAILMMPMGEIYNANYDHPDAQDEEYQTFYTQSRTLIVWLPFLLAIPMVIWMMIKAQEKQQGFN